MKNIKEATYNLSKLFRNLLRKDQALFDFEAFDQYLADTFFDEKYEMPSQSLFTDEGLAQLGAKNVANIEKSMIAALNNMRHYRYRLTNKRSDELLDMLSDYFDKVGGEVTIEEATYNLSKLFRNILGKDQELFDFEAFQEYLNDSKYNEEFEMPSESLFTVEGLANIGAREAYDIEESIVLALNDMHNYGYRLADKSSDQVVDMLSDYFDKVGGQIPIKESYEYDDVKEFCESLQDSLREKFGEFWLIDYKWSQSSVGSNSSYWTIIPDEFEIDKSKKPNKPNFEDLENLGTAMKISDHFNKGAENLNINLNSLPDLSENTVNKLTDKIYEIVMNDTYEQNYHYVMLESNKEIKESKLNKKLQECSLYSIPWEVYNINNLQDAKIVAEENFIFSYKDGEFNSEMGNLYKLAYNLNIPRENIDAYIMPLVYPRNKIKESTNKKGKNMKKFSKISNKTKLNEGGGAGYELNFNTIRNDFEYEKFSDMPNVIKIPVDYGVKVEAYNWGFNFDGNAGELHINQKFIKDSILKNTTVDNKINIKKITDILITDFEIQSFVYGGGWQYKILDSATNVEAQFYFVGSENANNDIKIYPYVNATFIPSQEFTDAINDAHEESQNYQDDYEDDDFNESAKRIPKNKIQESRLRKLLEDEEEIEIEDESSYIPEEEPIIQRVSNNDEFELISAGDMDEPINELPVYDVMAQDLSDKPFYLVIDNDGDEDDGVIITVPENDDEGASLEAAMEIVQKIVDNIPTEIVMEEDENGDEVEKEVEVPVEIIENDDNSVTIKGDLDKILDAIVGEVGREEIMADISTGKDVDVEVTSIVEESLVQKRINLVRKLQESKEITLLNTKKNEKHTYTDKEFSKYFSDEIRRVEEKNYR